MSRNPKWWRLWKRTTRITPASERRLCWQWKHAIKNGRWMADVFYGGIQHPGPGRRRQP